MPETGVGGPRRAVGAAWAREHLEGLVYLDCGPFRGRLHRQLDSRYILK